MKLWWHRIWWVFAVLGGLAWAGSPPDGWCWINRLPCWLVIAAGVPLAPPPPVEPVPVATHVVGPGRQHESIQTVPWERLKPGDVVEIHWREEPYRDKWYIPASGAEGAPIIVRGVRANGKRPVFDAANAVTRKYVWPSGVEADFNNEDRGILRIGDMEKARKVSWLVVEGIEFRGARARVPYIATNGRPWAYEWNAAGVYVEHGGNITIRDCEIHENGTGIFVASPVRPPDLSASSDVLIEYNYIHDNSYPGGGDQYHNLYLEGIDITVQWNRLGPPAGAEGNNLKDRSAGLVVRHNWIEGGNRQLDLVDTIHPLLAGLGGSAIVEGNVLIDHAGHDNAQIVNFGRDGKGSPRSFLRMAWNVLMSPRPDAVGLRVSDRAELQVAGNVLYADMQPGAGRWFWLAAEMPDPAGNRLRTVADFATVRAGPHADFAWPDWLAPGKIPADAVVRVRADLERVLKLRELR